METKDIFGFIQEQEASYKRTIPMMGGTWNWSMLDHIKTSFLYKNSQLLNGKDEFTPVKNITRPILNLQKRAEDIDVKDVQLYVDDKDKYHLSFLVKKYHDDVFVVENDIDSFIDQLNESRIDYGAGLTKRIGKGQREVVPLQSIAFCDQTDILSGPIGIKHYYSPSQLMDMASKGWGDQSKGATATLEEAIGLARKVKRDTADSRQADTPGKYIEIYEVHGNMPKSYMDPTDKSGQYVDQIFIGCFYEKLNGEKGKITLFHMPEAVSPFKLVKRDAVYGRALGFGGAEELFESQVWVNYDMIRMQHMLDAASKTILKATGVNSSVIAQKNKVKNMDNLQIIDVGQDSDLSMVDTFPRNLALFEKSVENWEAHAQQMGSANDAIMGESPTSGTPFKLQELVTQESHGLHDFRRGQYAKHLEEIYRDDYIPYIQKKICEGTTFLAELSLEELQYVTDCLVRNAANTYIKERILSGELVDDQEVEAIKQRIRDDMQAKGSKHFIEILKGEFKDAKLSVKVNIAGKQKNLASVVDKVVNVFRFAFSNPMGFAQTMQIPGMAKSFNDILEFSGLSVVDFSGVDKIAEKMAAQAAPQTPQPASQIA